MAQVIQLMHFRRARRLFILLVERFGIEDFLLGGREENFRLDEDRMEDAVGLAASWLELQTGEPPTSATLARMRMDLREVLIEEVAKLMVHSGF